MVSILLYDKTICNFLLNISVCLGSCNLNVFCQAAWFLFKLNKNCVHILFFNSCTHFSFILEAFIGWLLWKLPRSGNKDINQWSLFLPLSLRISHLKNERDMLLCNYCIVNKSIKMQWVNNLFEILIYVSLSLFLFFLCPPFSHPWLLVDSED